MYQGHKKLKTAVLTIKTSQTNHNQAKSLEMFHPRTPIDILKSNNIRLAIVQQQKKGRALAKKPFND